jgi:hypothetical protein
MRGLLLLNNKDAAFDLSEIEISKLMSSDFRGGIGNRLKLKLKLKLG